MENKIIGVIIFAFITIIVGVILLGTLSDQNQRISTLDTVTDKSFTASTTCTQVTSGCIDSITSLRNISVTPAVGNYTRCISSRDKYDGIQLTTTLYTGTLNATYKESPSCQYVPDVTSRNLSNLIPLFFVIAIMIAAFFYLRQTGIIDMF